MKQIFVFCPSAVLFYLWDVCREVIESVDWGIHRWVNELSVLLNCCCTTTAYTAPSQTTTHWKTEHLIWFLVVEIICHCDCHYSLFVILFPFFFHVLDDVILLVKSSKDQAAARLALTSAEYGLSADQVKSMHFKLFSITLFHFYFFCCFYIALSLLLFLLFYSIINFCTSMQSILNFVELYYFTWDRKSVV